MTNIYSHKIESVLATIKRPSNIDAILLYGSDTGVMDAMIAKIAVLFDVTQNLKINTANEILLHLCAYDLFHKTTLFKIQYTPGLEREFEKILNIKSYNLPIIIANDIVPSGPMRKLFATNDHLLSIACYSDLQNNAKDLVHKSLGHHANKMTSDALRYLIENLPHHYGIATRELEKINLYLDTLSSPKQLVELDTMMSLLNANMNPIIDQLVFAFINLNNVQYFQILEQIGNQNIENIIVLRIFIRYYNQFLIIHSRNVHITLDNAIKALQPPVFFAHVAAFKNSILKLSKLQILQTLSILYTLEKDSKLSTNNRVLLHELYFRNPITKTDYSMSEAYSI